MIRSLVYIVATMRYDLYCSSGKPAYGTFTMITDGLFDSAWRNTRCQNAEV